MFYKLLAVMGLFFVSNFANAQSVSINLGTGIYASQGAGTPIGQATVTDMVEIRGSYLTQAVAIYRNSYGLSTLPVGTVVTVTYRDGTSEKFVVTATVGSVMAVPVAGSQKDKDGNPINACDGTCSPAPSTGSGGDGSGSSGVPTPSWWDWLINVFGQIRTGEVTVGGTKTV